MLGKEKKQGDFFNDYVYGELLPEEDTLLSIARLVDFGFVEEEVADLYSEDRGRPSYPRQCFSRCSFWSTMPTSPMWR